MTRKVGTAGTDFRGLLNSLRYPGLRYYAAGRGRNNADPPV